MIYIILGILYVLFAYDKEPSFEVCNIDGTVTEAQTVESASRLINNSREASVMVYSYRESGIATGSGGIFRYGSELIVITAAHTIGSADNVVMIQAQQEKYFTPVVYYDAHEDISVLKMPVYSDYIESLRLRPLKKKDLEIGLEVTYSGYPNVGSLLTIQGYIAGLHSSGDLYMHSYGWSGASGSSVLDNRGRLVGILIALDVGTGILGEPTVIEDVVVVVPIWKLDFDELDNGLSK